MATPGHGVALVVAVTALVLLSALGFVVAGTSSPPGRASSGFHVAAPPSMQYPVTVTETGLPSGTNWTSVIAGTHHPTTNPSFTVVQGNGTYDWSVLAIDSPMADGAAGWGPNVTGGTFHVFGGPVYLNVTFLPAYNVTIRVSGLPVDLTWKVSLNGTLHSTNSTYKSFLLPNATGYVFALENPVPGSITGVRYAPSIGNYILKVAGANTSRTDPFTAQFNVVVLASPTTGGTVGPASGWVNNQTTIALGESSASGYEFVDWVGNGTGNYSGTAVGPSILVTAPLTEVARFGELYTVTFTETGLPSGAVWSVNLNGTLQSGTGPLALSVTNATYPYTIPGIAGYLATPSSGSVTVAGASLIEPITWSVYGYPISFTETGLPAGANWSVIVNGTAQYSSTSGIVFTEPNGSYRYSLGPVTGYAPSPPSGSVTVNGAAVSLPVSFTAIVYTVTFFEGGLPSGTSWTLTLGGTSQSSTGTSIGFSETDGTYDFSALGVTGYTASPATGSITVSGGNLSRSISWSLVNYGVSFTETGLPSGIYWGISLAGQIGSANTSVSNVITFDKSNGTYSVVALDVPGYWVASYPSNVTVNGAPVLVSLSWSAFDYSVTFTETGLPAGSSWSVVLNGALLSSSTSTITFSEANGSYQFSVTGVSGYSVSPSGGPVKVAGAGVSVALQFTQSPGSSTSILGLSWTDLALIVIVIVLIAALLAALLLRRRRPPAKTP